MRRSSTFVFLAAALLGLTFCQSPSSSRKPVQRSGAIVDPNATPTAVPTYIPSMPNLPNGSTITTGETANIGRGTDLMSSRLWAMSQAKQSVKIQAFIIKGDEAGYVFTDKLIELVQRGIKVKVAVDPVANPDLSSQVLYYRMKASGIEMSGDQPAMLKVLDLLGGVTQSLDLQGMVSSFHQANFRHHEKIFLVDGDLPAQGIAIVGGSNIANEYYQTNPANDPKLKWADQDVMMRGPIITQLNQQFEQNFIAIKNDMTQNTDTSGIAALLSQLQGIVKNRTVFEKLMRFDAQRLSFARNQATASFIPQWSTANDIRFIQSSPKTGVKTVVLDAYLSLINNAKSTIRICNSYFIPVALLQEALVIAARRGVKVEILTNHPDASDYPLVQQAGRTLYKNILNPTTLTSGSSGTLGGLRVFEWGGDKVLRNGYGIHHGKYAVFDDQISVVGSYNMDPRSIHYNSEAVAIIANPVLAQTLSNVYFQDISSMNAVEVSYQTALTFNQGGDLLSKLQTSLLVDFIPFL
jgi:phosphatidylserine/phosphatidylglycerophosphate/cardiolipin synthase-like enzyme